MGALLTMLQSADAAAGPPANPTWSNLVESPTGVSHALSYGSTDMVYQGRLYAVKGWDGSTRRNEAQYFDIAAGGWVTAATDSTGIPVRYASYARYGNKIYIFGGETTTTTTSQVRQYDMDANSWISRTSVPTAVNGAACALDEARKDIYLCGGRDGSGAYTSVVRRYDIAANSWDQTTGGAGATIPNAPVTAAFGAAFVWGDWLYYLPLYDGATIATVYKLDLTSASPTWTAAGTHPAPAANPSAFAYGGSLYLYCGYNGTSWANQGYRYDAGTESFTALNAMAGTGVASGWMGLHHGKLYAGAGRSATAYTQDVQEGV